MGRELPSWLWPEWTQEPRAESRSQLSQEWQAPDDLAEHTAAGPADDSKCPGLLPSLSSVGREKQHDGEIATFLVRGVRATEYP